jgi:two-component system, NtrC family, response regulator GlrR
VKLETRVSGYPGFAVAVLARVPIGTLSAIAIGMQQLTLTVDQVALIEETATSAPTLTDDDGLMSMPIAEAKHLVAAEFERRYLLHVMERASGSVSEAARLCGLDRTNFRRLLQRHGLR